MRGDRAGFCVALDSTNLTIEALALWNQGSPIFPVGYCMINATNAFRTPFRCFASLQAPFCDLSGREHVDYRTQPRGRMQALVQFRYYSLRLGVVVGEVNARTSLLYSHGSLHCAGVLRPARGCCGRLHGHSAGTWHITRLKKCMLVGQYLVLHASPRSILTPAFAALPSAVKKGDLLPHQA